MVVAHSGVNDKNNGAAAAACAGRKHLQSASPEPPVVHVVHGVLMHT